MLLGSNQTIEERIISILAKESLSPQKLWLRVREQAGEVTIQAVYKALRMLMAEGAVVRDMKKVALSEEWRGRLTELFSERRATFELAEGESVTYRFKDLASHDFFWKHTVSSFLKQEEAVPVFHYVPHEMWVHFPDREESQIKYLRSFEEKKRLGYLALGGETFMDKEYKRTYQSEFLSIDTYGPDKIFERNRHYSIIGDIIVTTSVSEELAGMVDLIYEESSPESDFLKSIHEVFKTSGAGKIKIERNKAKAKKLRKRISKNFFIPQEVINKHSLF
jgi:hypothetical protein